MEKQKHSVRAILKPIYKTINYAMFLAALSACFFVANLVLISYFLASIANNSPLALFGIEMGYYAILLIGFLSIIASILKMLAFKHSHLGAFRLEEILRTDISSHLAKLPLGYIITNGSGNLKKVFLDDVKNLHVLVADSTPIIAKSVVSSLLSFIVLSCIDYKLALVTLGVLLVGFLIMSFVLKEQGPMRKKFDEAMANVNKSIIEFVQAMPVVRTFDDGTTSFKRYHEALVSFKQKYTQWVEKTGLQGRISVIVLSPIITLIIVMFAGIYFLEAGSTELFGFIAALFLSVGLVDGFMPLMWMLSMLKKSQAAALRIQELLAENRLPLPHNIQTPQDASIVFEDVSFAYEDEEVLKDINFTAKANTITAFVGPSGAGKSTLANLIPRFWDVTKGKIRIGGVDIKQMSYEDLMEHVSFVFQDSFLFNDTILNNIKMANPSKTNEEIFEVAKAAQIHNFIISLENGYETRVNDRGVNLSGGQKQRIAIARAILKDTPIIILDEATAFSDPENEEEIIKALSNLIQGKTVIVIAHRLSTIKNVDQILVLDKGKIVQKGTHNKLVEEEGTYKNLWGKYLQAQNWNLGGKDED